MVDVIVKVKHGKKDTIPKSMLQNAATMLIFR